MMLGFQYAFMKALCTVMSKSKVITVYWKFISTQTKVFNYKFFTNTKSCYRHLLLIPFS